METTPKFVMPPTDTYTWEEEVTETRRLCEGDPNMLGAVVVGGRHSADCFAYPAREIQAGVKDPEPEYNFGPDGEYKREPLTRPW